MRRRGAWALAAGVLLGLAGCGRAQEGGALRVGSKKFTESVILGELAVQLARDAGARAEHRRELGGTRILFEALLRGDIDVYPEYTGTLREELLQGEAAAGRAGLQEALGRRGLRMTAPLGFQNTYAVGMRREEAARLGIRTLSDLARHPGLRLGFSNEFMSREDGWPALQARYGLRHVQVRGLDHELAYRALAAGEIAATDLYTTDAEVRAHDLQVLEDDLRHFPEYEAVLLYRGELSGRLPGVVERWERLGGRVDVQRMVDMNARARLERVPEAQVAAGFLADALGIGAAARVPGAPGPARRVLQRTLEHLALVGSSLGAAVLLGVPLGILAAKRRRAGRLVLALVGLVQTVPSLALLVLMIPLLGIGTRPAVAALLLYSLLPIVRSTHAGLTGIGAELRDSARALGLAPAARLGRIELPLASAAVLSGIKTSAVINVGTATLGALIGAGGYGQPILTGIRLADVGLILEGALPAAALALVAQGAFDVLERWVVPAGLRLERGR